MMPCGQDRDTLAAYLDGEVAIRTGEMRSSSIFAPARNVPPKLPAC